MQIGKIIGSQKPTGKLENFFFYELFQTFVVSEWTSKATIALLSFFCWLLLEVQWTQPFFIKVCTCKFLILSFQVSCHTLTINPECLLSTKVIKSIKLNTTTDIQNMNFWHSTFCQFVNIIMRFYWSSFNKRRSALLFSNSWALQ